MSIKIPIETSARHIHVSQEDFQLLFGEDAQLHYIKELSQPGQYLCQERLTVKGPKGEYKNMAILGPFRKETQIELSLTDTRKIGLPGLIRQSGDTVDENRNIFFMFYQTFCPFNSHLRHPFVMFRLLIKRRIDDFYVIPANRFPDIRYFLRAFIN